MYSNKDRVSNNDSDLGEQIKALQRALAVERGENHRFREEIRTLIRQQLVNADD